MGCGIGSLHETRGVPHAHGDRLARSLTDYAWTREAAIAELCVAMLPTFIVHEAVRRGALSVILAEHMRAPIAMHALHPSMRNQTMRARAFIDFLVDAFGSEPFWDQGLFEGCVADRCRVADYRSKTRRRLRDVLAVV